MSDPPPRILVVCTGNICRSPMAEGFLRRDLQARFGPDAAAVTSVGLYAMDGHEVTEGSVVAARERGVDIAQHRATQISVDAVREADLILCMTQEHRRDVVDLVPEVAKRTFTLKELVRLLRPDSQDGASPSWARRMHDAEQARAGGAPHPYPEDVADPIGQPLQAYRGVAWEIDDLVRRLDTELFGPKVEQHAEER